MQSLVALESMHRQGLGVMWRCLATGSLFGGGKRLVTLEDADDFVKESAFL